MIAKVYIIIAEVCQIFKSHNVGSVMEVGVYTPIRRIGTKFPCLYTYKKCIGTSVTQHLYLYKDFAYKSELDEINHVDVVLSTNIQGAFSQKYSIQNLFIDNYVMYAALLGAFFFS